MELSWPGGAQKKQLNLDKRIMSPCHWYDFHQTRIKESPVLATGKEKIALTVEGNEGHLTCHRAAPPSKSSKTFLTMIG